MPRANPNIHAMVAHHFVVTDNGEQLVQFRTSWASGWDLATGKPKLTPEFSDYSTGPKLVFPASSGARNWHPAAYDPQRNLYFAAVVDMGNLMFVPPAMQTPPQRGSLL